MTSTEQYETLRFYTEPSGATDVGRHVATLAALPADVARLADILHGLVIHEHLAGVYGVELSDDDRRPVHIRSVEMLLDRLLDDPRPLTEARPPAERLAGNCRHFSVLMAAMLRAHDIPARARCGFGAYFGTGWYEDHWVCEYWFDADRSWRLVDAQIDDRQMGIFPIDFDLTDVPRDRFVVAGDAWARCRAGTADPSTFGLSQVAESGDWWIAGNLLRDVAALNNVEMLPWDCWGAMPQPNETIDADRLALFDRLSGFTRLPDAAFGGLREAYAEDDRVRVPDRVYNAALDREEPVGVA